MKKIISFSLILLLLSVAASAQNVAGRRIHRVRIANSGSITRLENIQLHRDQLRYKTTQRNARRDGVVTPIERRRMLKARRKTRVDNIRFRHNDRRR